MNNIIGLFILFLLNAYYCNAQHFDWASSGSGMNSGMKFGVITPSGDVVTGMQHNEMSYDPLNIAPTMYGSAGDSIPLGHLGDEMVIFCYDRNGKFRWSLRSDFASNTNILGMIVKKNGNVVIAYTAYMMTGNIPVHPAPAALRGNSEFGVEDEPDGGVIDYFKDQSRFNGQATNLGFTVVFTELNSEGVRLSNVAVEGLDRETWSDFKIAPDGSMLISYEQNLRARDFRSDPRDVTHHIIVKLKTNYEFSWAYKVRFLSGGGNFIPTSAMTVGPAGEVYITGNAHEGVRLPGAKDHSAPTPGQPLPDQLPYDSYVARLSADGKLQWVKYTQAKSILYDITADEKHVFIGGSMRESNQFFGLPMDTTGAKTAFLGCLNLQGKPLWVQTFRAQTVRVVHADQHGNVFTQIESKSTQYDPPLIIGKDTLTNSYSDLIISLFNDKGAVQWTKSSNVMINERSDGDPVLMSDECGNIYVVAEMWFVMVVNLSVFDGALMRAIGYGAAPLVARIRTTLPAEIESINPSLTTGMTLSPYDPESGEDEIGNCIAIPAPWTLTILPNPSQGVFKAKASLSYADKNLTLEIYDAKGGASRVIGRYPFLEAGIHEFNCELPDLAGGLYILVLRGTGGAVSERVVIAR